MIDFYARRCRSCSRRAAVRQRCFRLTRRALRAHRFGGCSPAHRGDALLSTRSDARRSTNGTTARLRLLGRELARAEQLPPPRPPAPKPPHPPSSCANVTRSRLAVCKNEKNEDSAKADFRHLPPGHFVQCAVARGAPPLRTRTNPDALASAPHAQTYKVRRATQRTPPTRRTTAGCRWSDPAGPPEQP